jgi:hypothetical protein
MVTQENEPFFVTMNFVGLNDFVGSPSSLVRSFGRFIMDEYKKALEFCKIPVLTNRGTICAISVVIIIASLYAGHWMTNYFTPTPAWVEIPMIQPCGDPFKVKPKE